MGGDSGQAVIARSNAASYVVAFAALVFALVFVISSGMGFKWFFLGCVALTAACVAVVFPNFRLFMVLLLTACIPVAIQYDLFNHGGKYTVIEHFGGAQGSVVISLVDFPIMALFFVWLADLASAQVKLPAWTRLDTYVLLFILMSALSLFNTNEYALLWFEVVRYLKYFLLLWILRSYLVDEMMVRYALYVVVLAAGMQFLLACLQYFLFFTLPFPVGGVSGSQFELVNNAVIQRVSGTVGHCNTFAAYLLFPIVVSFVLLLADSSRLIRLLAAGFFVASCIALVLTFSRNAWLMTCLATAMLGVIGVMSKRISSGMVLGLVGLAMVILAGLIVSGVFEIILIRVLEDDGKAYDSRWDLISVALQMLADHPVLGIGLNSFEESMSHYDETGVTNVIQQPVHNVLFLIAAETGVISLAFFLLICKQVAGGVLRVIRRKDNMGFIVGVSAGVALLVLLLSNQFDVTLRKEPIIGMSVLFIAMVMGMAQRVREDAVEGHR